MGKKKNELCCVGLVTKRGFHRDKPGWRAGLAVIKSTAPRRAGIALQNYNDADSACRRSVISMAFSNPRALFSVS